MKDLIQHDIDLNKAEVLSAIKQSLTEYLRRELKSIYSGYSYPRLSYDGLSVVVDKYMEDGYYNSDSFGFAWNRGGEVYEKEDFIYGFGETRSVKRKVYTKDGKIRFHGKIYDSFEVLEKEIVEEHQKFLSEKYNRLEALERSQKMEENK